MTVSAAVIGVVAAGTASSEHAVTILSRDGALPYDRRTVRQLKALAEANGIPYRIDAYQNYGSDASACLKAGKDVRALCFGQTPAAPPELPENTPLRIYAANGEFIGLAASQQGYLKALRLMSTPSP